MKSRGLDHDLSHKLTYKIRSLGIELCNEHDMLNAADRITKMLQVVFAELPEVEHQLGKDAKVIDEILYERHDTQERRKQWAKEITYEAEIGLLFKDKLRISPEGIQWKKKCYPLDSITRVRWGGLRHVINGIPNGTSYTIAFGDDDSEAVIEMSCKDIYSTFIDKLWSGVCVRLMTEMLEAFKKGNSLRFDDALVDNKGIELPINEFFGSSERVYCYWQQLRIWSADGSFFIGAQDNKDAFVALSYIKTPNVHILESAIRIHFKNCKELLSSLMDDN
jgi:hypothetical protein